MHTTQNAMQWALTSLTTVSLTLVAPYTASPPSCVHARTQYHMLTTVQCKSVRATAEQQMVQPQRDGSTMSNCQFPMNASY